MSAQHIVLAGDSIFDNGGYVPGEPCVTEQSQAVIPTGWAASRIAVDGDCYAIFVREFLKFLRAQHI